MFIKQRLKYMRKYDSDLWGFVYNRKRKNNFFKNFRLSLVIKIFSYFKISTFKYKRLVLKKNSSFIPLIRNKNFKLKLYKFFRREFDEFEKFFSNINIVYVDTI